MAHFQTFFHGNLSHYHALCLKSFVDFGHTVVVYCYEDQQIPSFCQRAEAEELFPRDKIFYYKTGPGAGSIAALANLIRYEILLRHGGWWIDADVLCLSEHWADDEEIIVARQDEEKINNAVMKWPAHHPLISECRDVCYNLMDEVFWGQTGPNLVTDKIEEHNLLAIVRDPTSFYPIHWHDWMHPLEADRKEEVKHKVRSSQCLHLWWEIYRRNGITQSKPEPGSFVDEAIELHKAECFF